MRTNVVNAVRTCGISPKVIAGALAGIIVFALTKLAVGVDPILEQAINVLAMVAASWLAPPGVVVAEEEGAASDDVLDPAVKDRLRQEGQGIVEVLLVILLVLVILAVLGVGINVD